MLIVEVDRRGGWPEVFFFGVLKNKKNALVQHIKKCTANDMNHALEIVLVSALSTSRNWCMNIECTGWIVYYTPSISIKKHCFYQMPFNALNGYNNPGALLYDAMNGELLNTTHRPWSKTCIKKSVYQFFIDLKAPMCDNRMHRLNFLSYNCPQYNKKNTFYQMLINSLKDYKFLARCTSKHNIVTRMQKAHQSMCLSMPYWP